MASYNPYEQKVIGYEQQRKLAESLRNAEMPQGQMIGQHYVAANPLSQIGTMLRQYAGMEMEDRARKGIEDVRKEQGQALKDWQAAMPKTKVEEMAGPVYQGETPTRTTKPTAEDYMAWAQQGMAIDPSAAAMGMQSANMQLTREANAQALQAKMIEAQQARQERFEQQKELARLAASLRPAPQERMVSVIGPDGQTPVLVPQSQARGMTPFVAGGVNKPGSPAGKIQDANEALAILQQAAPLVNKATGSGLGAAYDASQALFGFSNAGAENAAKLKTLGGMLVSKMPKMSGPQSDKDVLLYKEMAGRIGDPTVPAAQKMAAMDTINEIQARYAGVEVTPLDYGGGAKSNGRVTSGAKFLGFE